MWFGARFASVRCNALRFAWLVFFFFRFQFQSQFRSQFLGIAHCLANRRMGGRTDECAYVLCVLVRVCVGHPCGCPSPGFICCVQVWHAYCARIANFGLINNICFIRSFPFCLFNCALCPAGSQTGTYPHAYGRSIQCGFFDEISHVVSILIKL